MSSLLSPTVLRPILLFAGCLGTIIFVQVAVARKRRNPRGLPLPPGPRGLPIIGNIRNIPAPQDYPWKQYHELCKVYGGMVYMSVMGQGILVLGTLAHANELLDKRAAKYSDRPILPAVELNQSTKWSFGAMSYGTMWRTYRRAFHQHLHHNRVAQYHPIMDEQRDEFLRNIRERPVEFLDHLKMYFGYTIIRASYGIDDMERNKLFIHGAESIVDGLLDGISPGKYLVNEFPILKHIPEWVPGAGFRKTFRTAAEVADKAIALPYEEVKKGLAQGKRSIHPSMATTLIDNLPNKDLPNGQEMDDLAKHVCATAYISKYLLHYVECIIANCALEIAGADTSVASATALVLALASHPVVQKRAQAELDAIVGTDRLPLLSDRESLPYLQAVVKEVGRWHSVGPLGIGHSTIEDDEYQGYFIPKGTIVMANSWAIMHDPVTFEKPFDFIPERYLRDGKIDLSVPDPEVSAFGFGRRICPGRHFSNDAIFLLAASLLSTFDITPPKDETGKPIELKLEVTSHLASKPLPFKCNFTLRQGTDV